MARRSIVPVTLDNLSRLPETCHVCGFWESGRVCEPGTSSSEEAGAKREWYERVLSEWGACGLFVEQGDEVLAYCQFGPANRFPQLGNYSNCRVDANAVFIACLFVAEGYRSLGLGKLLLIAAQKEMIKRGYKALETYARREPAKNPSGWTEFYLANGWQIIDEFGQLALLRRDMRANVGWQVNLESVLEGLNIPIPGRTKIKAPMPG